MSKKRKKTESEKNRPAAVADTICWKCRKPGTGGCCWDASRGVTPVPGWTATETIVMMGEHNLKRPERSFVVKACPLYELDETADLREPERGAFGAMSDYTLVQLLREGLTDEDIAEMHGIKVKSVSDQKRRLGRRGIKWQVSTF